MPIPLPIFGLLAQASGTGGKGLWDLFLDAGTVDKFILLTLALFSLVSWGIILSKSLQFRKADRHTKRFLDIFRTSKRFSEVNAAASNHSASPLVGLFQSGYVEIDAQVKAAQGEAGDPSRYRIRSLTAIERTLRRALGVELHVLTRSTQFLATTAAAAPFIGLFGTVWGIMNAFHGIGVTGTASLAAYAPGIAEALVATAAGLFAAIPALIGYNHFMRRLRLFEAGMDEFSADMVHRVLGRRS